MTQIVSSDLEEIWSEFQSVRETTLSIFEPLSVEDAVMQSDPFGSPPNWHLAHVTWFFQKVLEKYGVKFQGMDNTTNTDYLNSYYQKFHNILPKTERGRYPRPTVSQTLRYRKLVEDAFSEFFNIVKNNGTFNKNLKYDFRLANQHEMQHQELMIYDIQHYFNRFPDPKDSYRPKITKGLGTEGSADISTPMAKIPGGLYDLGFAGDDFCYDNELPEHKAYFDPFEIDIHPVTNGGFMNFINDGGYEDYRYWLADGWDLIKEKRWSSPLYWERREEGLWYKKDFHGLSKINPKEPVVNVSYFEADAYAKWIGKRLPTEAEWEKAASWNDDLKRKTKYPWGDGLPTENHANLLESWLWAPSPIGSFPDGKSFYGCYQMIGDVWEWTASEYVLYPRFRSVFPEYTDKWSIGHKVLRGGSFATPRCQVRSSYRNYFKPHERILFAGFRCVRDAT
ncbi:MAG: ergothioneine biosynthesis protein EgtB [Thermoproteota archaeon]|nr:ergothioneine biosynthesis protein EgtB [Thermoproteota archaeon]